MRRYAHVRLFLHEKFQSTHPLRGATIADIATLVLMKISIHAPLAGCDAERVARDYHAPNFNPRTPCGVRLPKICNSSSPMGISIHAPLAGCDSGCSSASCFIRNFNPRTPCGVRPRALAPEGPDRHFNPRTPCGVRRRSVPFRCKVGYFNPRTPCGVRRTTYAGTGQSLPFQSTHPLRGATVGLIRVLDTVFISIHAPLAGCDNTL